MRQIYQFYCMQRNNSQNFSKFYLPNGLATNSKELKLLQNKLLTNHYNTSQFNDLSQKSSKGLSNKSANFVPYHNEMTKEQTLSSYDMLASNSSKQVKAALSNDLLQQMRIKNMKKKQQKQQVLNHQQILTKHISHLEALQKERQKQFFTKYKQQAKQDMKIKEEKKRKEVAEYHQEQSYYKNRYNNAGDFIPSMQSLPQLKSSYTNPTKDYYYEVDQAMRQRNQVVPNPEGIANNSSFKITRNNQQLKKLDFMYAGQDMKKSYQKQRSFYEGIRGEDLRYRNELKQTLISQIKQKEQRKKAQKIKEFTKPYTNSQFQQIHHPINNPVDFRIAHDNKYVLGQLKSIQ